MKQKMVECVHEAAEEFRKLTSRTMADTTKRAISENVVIEQQLAKMNEKTTEVHHDNQNLRRCVVAQKHQVFAHSSLSPLAVRPALGSRGGISPFIPSLHSFPTFYSVF